jgi:hypothetical protein
MRIISKYRDYYDHLSGIWGVDNKIILDRRDFSDPIMMSEQKVVLHVCGFVYEGFYRNGEFYWGKDLLQIGEISKKNWRNWLSHPNDGMDVVAIAPTKPVMLGDKYSYVHLNPYPDKDKNNDKANCAILMFNLGRLNRYPILYKLQTQRMLDAESLYLMLCQWLAPKDIVSNTMTDKEKVVANGFDLKSSFRNVK